MRRVVTRPLRLDADLRRRASRLLRGLPRRRGLEFRRAEPSPMGGWYVRLENAEFLIEITQDRAGEAPSIAIGTRLRPRPRAPLRGPWSLSHLRGFLDGQRDHFRFQTLSEEVRWLHENEPRLFDSVFLNSEALRVWSVRAARRMFGGAHPQDDRGQPVWAPQRVRRSQPCPGEKPCSAAACSNS